MSPQDLAIVHNFRLLDSGTNEERAYALEWLLNHTANNMYYLDGRRKLYEDLDVRFVTAFYDWPTEDDLEYFVTAIENHYSQPKTVTLTHRAVYEALQKIVNSNTEISFRAKKLCTKIGLSWVRYCTAEIQLNLLQRLAEDPTSNEWIILGLYREFESISDSFIDSGITTYRQIQKINFYYKILFGAILFLHLSSEEKVRLINLAVTNKDSWSAPCLSAITKASIKNNDVQTLQLAIDNYFVLIEDQNLDKRSRINAAKYLIQFLTKKLQNLSSIQEIATSKLLSYFSIQNELTSDFDLKSWVKKHQTKETR